MQFSDIVKYVEFFQAAFSENFCLLLVSLV